MQMVSAEPKLVKYKFALTSTTPLLVVNDHFCWIFREVCSAQQAEMARFGQTSIGSPEHLRRTASSWTTPTRPPLRQPRLQILTHHLIRRTPYRTPAYIHRSPPQLAITACACPRHICSATRNQGPIRNSSSRARSSETSPAPPSTATRSCVAGENNEINGNATLRGF